MSQKCEVACHSATPSPPAQLTSCFSTAPPCSESCPQGGQLFWTINKGDESNPSVSIYTSTGDTTEALAAAQLLCNLQGETALDICSGTGLNSAPWHLTVAPRPRVHDGGICRLVNQLGGNPEECVCAFVDPKIGVQGIAMGPFKSLLYTCFDNGAVAIFNISNGYEQVGDVVETGGSGPCDMVFDGVNRLFYIRVSGAGEGSGRGGGKRGEGRVWGGQGWWWKHGLAAALGKAVLWLGLMICHSRKAAGNGEGRHGQSKAAGALSLWPGFLWPSAWLVLHKGEWGKGRQQGA